MIRYTRYVLLSCVLAFAAIAKDSPDAAVQVSSAWSRATPPNATVGAAFMSFVAAQDDRLLAASTRLAAKVEMHSMREEQGAMRMRPLTALELPKDKVVSLSPTGTHMMLVGLTTPLRAGAVFEMTLTFERAGQRTVRVRVIAPNEQP
jgi:periplasmic copper chaperone A